MDTLSRNQRAWIQDFMRHATAENIRDLLIDINDALQSRHTWLNDSPLTDLSDQITEVEDAIWEWENDPAREAEKREEWREMLEDEKRDNARFNGGK